MAKTGGWCRKLTDKMKANATNDKLGRQRAVITRSKSTFADKHEAFRVHCKAIATGRNDGPRWTYVSKNLKDTRKEITFHGDGLPDDSLGALRTPKPQVDKRKPLKDEMRPGFASQRWSAAPTAAKTALESLRR